MKPLFVFLFAVSFWALSANAQDKNMKQAKNSNSPYKVENNNVRIGNQALAQKVLMAWKDFDNNTLENSMDLFTEDVVATFPDGSMVKGRDNFLKMGKEYRSILAAVSSNVHACVPLVSTEGEMNGGKAVSIWGTEIDTHKDGTVTKTELNEIWFFNKDGKVFEFHQTSAKIPAEKN